jgi:hypothetical protein
VLTVIVIIMGGICAVLTVIATIMTVTGRSICSGNSYCDNNREVYMQC